ncbi:MAG: transglycosylase domain-containing protein [Roseburia sp.]|nr:transglycosylase domain-containing protein [Roseburia sp.]
MNRALKTVLIILISAATLTGIAFASFFIVTADASLNPEKLVDYDKTIYLYDDEGNKIEDASYETKRQSVKLEDLNKDTVNAFIASEDRNFYSHNGLNYRRMFKALYKNIASRSFKEGASTISQQLIKNTHLNSDKTIARKLKEIKLTKQLERRYGKDDILEMYLNTIYFGHNCFGLQSAANFYFGKPASELSLEQSATIVGLLTSPNNYSPFKNSEKCLARRNIVLKNMLDCSFIDKNTYESAKNAPLSATRGGDLRNYPSYIQAVFDEFEGLNIDPYGRFGELNIKTYLNRDAQNMLDRLNPETDYSLFLRSNSGGVAAFRSTVGSAKRQIGSVAKPLFVYAPAIEEKKLNVFTKIMDEPINYGGYSPENHDKKYHGQVSVTDSIKYSYNIPAVKTLNTLNFDSVESYASKMNIKIDADDKNLALALGAMKDGLTLKQLCDAYSVFANSGTFTPSHFIKEVCDDSGKIIYSDASAPKRVFSKGTCSLINGILCETAQSGTAKRLKNCGADVACKTGTCGDKSGNTDAYSVAYTKNYCLGVWLGDKDNKKLNVTGGGDCCTIANEILKLLNDDGKLDKDTGTETVFIDREEYEKNGKVLLCDPNSPKLNKLAVKCLTDNLPREQSDRFSSPVIKKPSISVKNNEISIELCQTKYYSYLIKRDNIVIYDGDWVKTVTDEPTDGEYEYSVTPYFSNGDKKFYGKEIKLPRVILRRGKEQEKLPDIAFKDWYNQ